MDIENISLFLLQPDLADCFQKRLGFHITDRPADLADQNVRVSLFRCGIDEFLDLIGNVRYRLDRFPQIVPSSLFLQNIPVNLSRRQITEAVQIFIDKALVMPQIQICLRTVFRHVHFPVLQW